MKYLILSALLVTGSAIAATPNTAADQAEAASGAQEKMICKRFPVIGSLIESRKECKTKRQWENERANLTMRDPLGSCNGSGGKAAAQGGSLCGDGH